MRRLIVWLKKEIPSPYRRYRVEEQKKKPFPVQNFWLKAGLITGIVPLAGIGVGIISGAYDYRVRRQLLYLPNLPKAFNGMTIGQISDVHSGSFYNKKAVERGIELLLQQKPEVIFFTGDLVKQAQRRNVWLPGYL